MSIKVITNGRQRDLLRWQDLTAKERGEFDYMDTEDKQLDAEFVRYRGWVYDVSEFMHSVGTDPALSKWDGYRSDSYFSGVLIKLCPDDDAVIMGTYYQ